MQGADSILVQIRGRVSWGSQDYLPPVTVRSLLLMLLCSMTMYINIRVLSPCSWHKPPSNQALILTYLEGSNIFMWMSSCLPRCFHLQLIEWAPWSFLCVSQHLGLQSFFLTETQMRMVSEHRKTNSCLWTVVMSPGKEVYHPKAFWQCHNWPSKDKILHSCSWHIHWKVLKPSQWNRPNNI